MSNHNVKLLRDQHQEIVPVNSGYSWIDSLATDTTKNFVSIEKTEGCITLKIKLLVVKNHDIEEIILYSIRDGDELRLPLQRKINRNHEVWWVNVKFENEAMLSPFSYRFKINTCNKSLFFDASGVYKYKVHNNTNFKFYYTHSAPEWLKSAVFYHIFIDSFKKSLPHKDNHLEWGGRPPANAYEFYGGDLLGIKDSLDYLLSLGVNTLCITPIFKSSTNHKYDVEDYFRIDDGLGGDEAFKALSVACKKRNIKIILDGVFNHISGRSSWFNRDRLYSKDGAYQSLTSHYSSFFKFTRHPELYEAFWADKYLPKLNYQSAELRNIVYRDKNSIIKYWMSEPYAIDGWRLDACCMIGKHNGLDMNAEVLCELYSEAKKSKKNCYIFGEYPFDPSEVLQYKHVDGITNYSGFYSPLVYWLDKNMDFDASDMDDALMQFRASVGAESTNFCKNFFGNHDKKRLFNIIQGDLEAYFTAIVFLFTYPGVPTIYYGDEIGLHDMKAVDDSRISMKWNSLTPINQEIFCYTKSMIDLYKSSKAIQSGSFRVLHSKNNFFIYERFDSKNYVLIVLNNSKNVVSSLSVKTASIDYLSVIDLQSYGGSKLSVTILSDGIIAINNIIDCAPIILCARMSGVD